jgi:VWFA-related protein
MNTISRFVFTLLVLVIVLGAAPTAATAQGAEQARITQIDSSSFPQVTAYVSVTGANGEPIGVDPNRITLLEDGKTIKPSQIRAIGKQTGQAEPLTTLLVIDVSGSMKENGKLDSAKNAAKAYVDQMRPGDQVGVVAFSTHVQYVQPITADRNAIKSSIDQLKPIENTAMYDALSEGVKTLAQASGRKTIIALTDGMDNSSSTNADNVVSSIGPSGLTISTIGFGDPSLGTLQYAGLDEARLKSIADRTGGLYAAASDGDALKKIYERYARTLQNEYAITFTSLTQLRDGVNRSLSVSLVAPNGAPINTQSKYNPGGVVPEIPKVPAGLPIFPIALAGLILLLLAPTIITRAGGFRGLNKSGGRIRLGTSSTAFSKSPPPAGRLANARSAVKKFFSGIGRKKKSRVRILDAGQPPLRTR